jgi:hypothetical protein
MAYPKINGTSVALNGFTNNGAPKTGLRILIVGAGIGGLTAAIALRRQGHKILVYSYKILLKSSQLTPGDRSLSSHNLQASWERPFTFNQTPMAF